jgi:UDPglucose 6-dehydrogenase
MKVCVQGMWHLGSVTAACLASVGHEVVGLDLQGKAFQGLRRAVPPVSEPGLADLIGEAMAAGRLGFTNVAAEALAGVDVLWVAYDTPVDANDEADVESVVAEVESVLPHLREGATVVVSSQLPVGSVRRLEKIAGQRFAARSLGFASSPENLRLGKALEAFLKPDRVVVGVRNGRDRDRIDRLLAPITRNIEWMTVESAEMTKHAINSFLAASVVFANEIAAICEQVGADAKEVERGLKSESRIGPRAYLSPGGAFAGGTLARDVEYLKSIGSAHGLGTELLKAIKASNDRHKNWARRRLAELIGPLTGRTIAIWGLTYKPGTDTLRRSLAVELCDYLLAQRARVRVHDPAAEALPVAWAGRVERTTEPLEALSGADALVVATEWPQYKQIAAESLGELDQGFLVLDANRFLSHWKAVPAIRYVAVGSPSENARVEG